MADRERPDTWLLSRVGWQMPIELMVHGTFGPHPGRLIRASLQPYIAQLEYRELERCGHYPWLEKAVSAGFFSLIREWLQQRMRVADPKFRYQSHLARREVPVFVDRVHSPWRQSTKPGT